MPAAAAVTSSAYLDAWYDPYEDWWPAEPEDCLACGWHFCTGMCEPVEPPVLVLVVDPVSGDEQLVTAA